MLSKKMESHSPLPLRSGTFELTILLVEDSESDAYVVERVLGAHMPCSCHIIHVSSLEEADRTLSARDDIDLVLLDLGLPDSSSNEETYTRLSAYREEVPIIVLTSVEDNDLAVNMLGLGAQDYVQKSEVSENPEALCKNIQFAIGRHYSMEQIRQENSKQRDLLKMMTGSYSVIQS